MRTIAAILSAIILFPLASFAAQRCPIEGTTFNFTPRGSVISYELTDFDCAFGPGCQGTCSFWYGNLELGPVTRIPLDFSCRIPKGASPDEASISIAGLPCYLGANATKLICVPINMKDYHEVEVSGKTFFIPTNVNPIQFNRE